MLVANALPRSRSKPVVNSVCVNGFRSGSTLPVKMSAFGSLDAMRKSYWQRDRPVEFGDRAGAAEHVGVAAEDAAQRVGVVGRVREDLEVVRPEEVAAERAARQLELQAILELVVAGEQLRAAVAGQVVRDAEARHDLVAPAEVDGRRVAVERRQVFLLHAHAGVDGQARRRLPAILEVERVGRVGRGTHGAEALHQRQRRWRQESRRRYGP